MEEKEMLEQDIQSQAIEADSVVKIICAIMNEEENIDAYEEKSIKDMQEIFNSVAIRFPNNDQASFDPSYVKFGQACMNGYATFGIDFFKQLSKRTDSTQSLCFKGLIDLYMNMLIQNQELALSLLTEEERLAIEKDLVNQEDKSDEEFLEQLNKYE